MARYKIGSLEPKAYESWKAVCETCPWYWQGPKERARAHLEGHFREAHPPAVPVYIEVGDDES